MSLLFDFERSLEFYVRVHYNLFTSMLKREDDKGIVYCNRVRLGNWYEAATLEEVTWLFLTLYVFCYCGFDN